ncbi:hypothetical protein CEUSTIGMA_g11447.t1 [Chlamydomonas eustigma]|uniref:Uncharacterized protein n=1 Tax=Chlamydomonas eustigma TaxID=1157962 RepID=A0A250XM96_9CHLO|nr:hypothetical protein CEUSTIGMA_g11447.t1 [Chlamydomonas eustigma]|eukprot:GAX84022.1 hypothetical protein CEUSTIGMA_g11447.t1 [Chlamydomonas eustigma]
MSLNNLDDLFEEILRDNVVDQIQHERETLQACSTSHNLQGWQRQRHQRRKRARSSLQVMLQPKLSSEVKQKVCTVHKLDSLIQREENCVSKSLKTPFLSKASTESSTKERIHLLSSLKKCAAIADFSSQQEVPFMNSNVGTDHCNERYDHAEAVSKTGVDAGYENQHKEFKGVQSRTSTSASQSAVKLAATSCLHDLNKDYLDDAERSCLTTCASGLPWKKVLWRQQGRPDNFTDSSFLQELASPSSLLCTSHTRENRLIIWSMVVVNASVPVRKYPQVVLASAAITQQICTVVASMSVAAHLAYSSISVPRVLWACAGLLVAGYLVCALLGRHLLGGSVIRGMRQCCLLVGGEREIYPALSLQVS